MGMKMRAVLAPSEGGEGACLCSRTCSGLATAVSSLGLPTLSSLRARVSPNVPSDEETSRTGLEPALRTSLVLDGLCQGPVSENVTGRGPGGQYLSGGLWGTQIPREVLPPHTVHSSRFLLPPHADVPFPPAT